MKDQNDRGYQQWYDENKARLSQNGLWLRGGELGTLPAEEYGLRPLRTLFVRLSSYLDTGYSFTHQFLYQIAKNTEGVFPDLAYLPPPKDAAVFAEGGVPWLLGTQTKLGPSGFDVVGFSNSIVQELVNIPQFLKRSGIPLQKKDRMERPDIPLLILGGANALFSSCIWMDEAVVDGVFVGESDAALSRILAICRDGKKEGLPKADLLKRLEQVPGFFQPDARKPTKKNFAMNLNEAQPLIGGPVYHLADQAGNSHLQISEGCPCFCSFCAEAWERRPYRERSAAVLKSTALEMKANMGLDRIDIYSFNFNMHSELYQILWDLVPHFRHIGLKSQRFDLLAHDPEMLKFQQVLDKTSLTCGLEGISPRLREYLNKNLSPDDLHASLEAIFKNKARELKVFLIATGLEEEQDFVALGDLLDHIKNVKQRVGSRTRVIFSMTPLVRFPWTPLEFADGYPMGHYAKIINRAAGCVRSAGFEFRESADLPEYWVSQVLVRADRPEISRALLRAVEKSGFVYYRAITEGFRKTLEQELASQGLDADNLLRGFDLQESALKPWAMVDPNLSRSFLWEMYQKLQKYKEIDYCLGRSWTHARCSHCGGCPTRFHVRAIVLAEQKKPYTLEAFKNRRSLAMKSEKPLSFMVDLAPHARGLPRKIAGVALARALMLAHRPLAEMYRGYGGAVWDQEESPTWISGLERIDLVFSEPAHPVIAGLAGKEGFRKTIDELFAPWGRALRLCDAAFRPSKLIVDANASIDIDSYFRSSDLKHSLRKTERGYAYEFIPPVKKRGLVLEALKFADEKSKTFHYELTVGPKFDWMDFENGALRKAKGFQFPLSAIRAI